MREQLEERFLNCRVTIDFMYTNFCLESVYYFYENKT